MIKMTKLPDLPKENDVRILLKQEDRKLSAEDAITELLRAFIGSKKVVSVEGRDAILGSRMLQIVWETSSARDTMISFHGQPADIKRLERAVDIFTAYPGTRDRVKLVGLLRRFEELKWDAIPTFLDLNLSQMIEMMKAKKVKEATRVRVH